MMRVLLAMLVVAGGLVTGGPGRAAAGADALPGGTFTTWVGYEAGNHETGVASTDLSGDGIPDVAVTSHNELRIFPGGGDGYLAEPSVYDLLGTFAKSVAVGDLNGDGRADLAVTTAVYVEVFYQTPGGSLSAAGAISMEAYKAGIADVTGDGRADLVVLGEVADIVAVFPQTEVGTLAEPRTYTVPLGGFNDLELGDVDGDGDTDVVAMSGAYVVPDITVLLQHDGALVISRSYSLPGDDVLAHGVGVGDVDGDGLGEVVVSHGGNRPDSKLSVFEAAADGSLRLGKTFDVADVPEPVVVADVDNDGFDDVVTAHGGWVQASVLYGSSSGLALPIESLPLPYATHYDPHGLAAADLDLDGYPELLVADYNYGLLVLANRGATATAPEPEPAPEVPAPLPSRLSIQSTEVFCANVVGDDNLFTDDDGTTFEEQIRCLAHSTITAGGPAGLPANQYGPGLVVTRAQMASFIVREIETANRLEIRASLFELGAEDGRHYFTDVAVGSVHEQAINRLARAGIISGGPGGRPAGEFGPDLPVTRAQMASFINRSHELLRGTALTTASDHFTDDDGNPHEASINAIASEGIAVGDRRTTYSPERQVTRGQMAAFLLRHLAMMEHDDLIAALPA